MPTHGNSGYKVESYELDLDYRVSSNRLSGKATITAVATQALSRVSFDLADLRVAKVFVNGRRAGRYAHRNGKLHVWPSSAIADGAEFVVDVQYSGNPAPVDSPWGELGWEELTEGVIVASQPSGAATWFPCNDHPSDKAHYRITITTDSPYHVVANGTARVAPDQGQPDQLGLRPGRADGDVPGDGPDRPVRRTGAGRRLPSPREPYCPRRSCGTSAPTSRGSRT